MTPREPTTEDLFVADPLTREAGPRGVEPWEIVPGAPPVRGRRTAARRTLLRDGTVHRGILEKARATPTPAPSAHRRDGERARKPDGHEREYFKPAAPLITNVVVDRPPPVRKAADPTWEPAPEREAAPTSPEAAVEDDPDNAWFFEADGTLEPAAERIEVVPPRRIAAFLGVGAALAAVALVAVAIGQGSAGSRAEAVAPAPSVVAAAPIAEPAAVAVDATETPAAEPTGSGTAEVAPAPVAAAPAPVTAAPAPAPVTVAPARVASSPAPAREPAAREPAPTAAIDRLRASMSGNDLLGGPAPAPTAEPAPAPTEPARIPEGSAELWGPIESTTAPAGGPWGDLRGTAPR